MSGVYQRLIPDTADGSFTRAPRFSSSVCSRSFLLKTMLGFSVTVAVVIAVVVSAAALKTTQDSDYSYEKDPTYWHNVAQSELDSSLREPPMGVAKNVILFLGDGMGPTSVTAGRILAGQLRGKKGEEFKLNLDLFPYTGLSKTYNVDSQITDSAASGTAYLTGVKTKQGLLGLSGAATRKICSSTKGAEVDSILRWSAVAGKSTGVVTTTRVTHATPAASYSHSADRDWESDRNIPESERTCEDIALQLVTRNQDINVIMGGGRAYFYPEGFADPEPDPAFNTSTVSRLDNRNLVEEWKADKAARNMSHQFVFNKEGFEDVSVTTTDYLLGLFNQDHMTYDIDRNASKEPSIAEMTQKAIEILKKNENGFFLLVEGGKIDHGHHASQAHYALSELVAMDEAIDVARKVTDEADTLIVVTADHSHVMNIAGYSVRGAPILGLSLDGKSNAALKDVLDKQPYSTILYGNGPGYGVPRQNLTETDTSNKAYVFQSAVPMAVETHGGEDVTIYASGPQSFLYTGVHEQNYIPIVMAYASCVGPYASGGKQCAKDQLLASDKQTPKCTKKWNDNSASTSKQTLTVVAVNFLLYIIVK